MDWNKTKSIFILVFLILNVFLYTQYVGTYNAGQHMEILGEKNIEAKLKEDHITYNTLPSGIETAPYLSAKVKKYGLDELPAYNNFQYKLVTENTLVATLKAPVKLLSTKQSSVLTDFVQQYVYEGMSFTFWEIDEEARTAIFFQVVNDRTLYFNKNGYVKIHWNADNEVYMYEQSMLEKVEEIEQQENIDPPLKVLQALYAKNLLKQEDHIKEMKLGYSTLVQLTQAQVFAPTWEVYVETAEKTTERYFVNAVEGKVVDIGLETKQVLEE